MDSSDPLYTHQLIEGRRSAAESTLMDIAQREQQYILDQRAYAYGTNIASVSANLNVTIPSTVQQFYTITVAPGSTTTPPSFIATATPVAGSVQASDVTLTIDQTGQKLTQNPSGTW